MVKKKIEPGTFRFLMYFNEKIICERIWCYDIEKTPLKFELEIELDEVSRIIETHLNRGYEDNEITHQYVITYDSGDHLLESIVNIRKRPWKELYRLDIRPLLTEIRDRLKLGMRFYM